MSTNRVGSGPVAGAQSRYSGLESAFDPVSRRHLARTGLGPGWNCWEVGAGGGSIARWLADRVAPTGSVLATDIDTTGMSAERRSNLRVERHDLVVDPLPVGTFRCIHARLVMGQLPERVEVLERLASALVPGGWLVIEDLELLLPLPSEVSNPDQRLVHKVRSGFIRLLRDSQGDGDWARSLPCWLGRLGHVDVCASTHVAVVTGGSAAASLEQVNLRQVQEQLVGFGVATHDQVDRCLQLLGDPRVWFTMPPMVSASGRRPADRRG